jgi:hypothetical protein
MINKLVVIIPSRGRPDVIEELADEFYANATAGAQLVVATDDDEPEYPKVNGVLYERGPRLRMNGTLNKVARDYCQRYAYVGFMGDDHRARTPGFDEKILVALQSNFVAYGNDLIWGEGLPTAVFMRSEVVQKLGFMAPPKLIHLYMDNFWLELGRRTSIAYLPDVIIEHLHPSVGKADWTPQYQEVNDQAVYDHDREALNEYYATQFEDDLGKLLEFG